MFRCSLLNSSLGDTLSAAILDNILEEFGMQPRNDFIEHFRTATMKRNPDLQQSLPSKLQGELESRDEYAAPTRQIEDLTLQVKDMYR